MKNCRYIPCGTYIYIEYVLNFAGLFESIRSLSVTVKEIAELADVSVGTVDRVLHKRGRFSAETKSKIEAIIEKYQFTPNPIARRLKRNRAYYFCALIPQKDQDAGYWGQALEGIRGGSDEISPLGVKTEIIEFDRYQQGAFQAAADAVLQKPPDGIVFAPIMPDKTQPFIRRIQDMGIPYVFIDADIPGMSPLCAIGQDSFQGGYLAGRLMHLLVGKSVRQVAVLNVNAEDYHIIRRRDGFLRYTAEHTIPTVTKEYSGFLGTALLEQEIMLFLNKYPKLSGVFITNSLAYRVAQAVRKLGRDKEVVIIGYDLVPNNHRLLKEGHINAIISQRPQDQGRQALLQLYRHLVLEQKVPSKVEIPLDMYLKENVPPEV
jgi:LacI family transcriptional regulator